MTVDSKLSLNPGGLLLKGSTVREKLTSIVSGNIIPSGNYKHFILINPN